MRKRTLILLLLPIILIIWTIGWALFWTGEHQQTGHKQPTQQHDNTEITVRLPQQQEQEITE